MPLNIPKKTLSIHIFPKRLREIIGTATTTPYRFLAQLSQSGPLRLCHDRFCKNKFPRHTDYPWRKSSHVMDEKSCLEKLTLLVL